ncbi:hypothetical protein JW935_05965 [candidate division KSB1 bacterium]|nr:hypothetical protein [candidate division KSB1 bacterium]
MANDVKTAEMQDVLKQMIFERYFLKYGIKGLRVLMRTVTFTNILPVLTDEGSSQNEQTNMITIDEQESLLIGISGYAHPSLVNPTLSAVPTDQEMIVLAAALAKEARCSEGIGWLKFCRGQIQQGPWNLIDRKTLCQNFIGTAQAPMILTPPQKISNKDITITLSWDEYIDWIDAPFVYDDWVDTQDREVVAGLNADITIFTAIPTADVAQ